MNTMKSAANIAPVTPEATSRARSTWKSWVIVVLLGLLAWASPYLNPQSVKTKVSATPAQSD
jgi:hypothetical protein